MSKYSLKLVACVLFSLVNLPLVDAGEPDSQLVATIDVGKVVHADTGIIPFEKNDDGNLELATLSEEQVKTLLASIRQMKSAVAKIAKTNGISLVIRAVNEKEADSDTPQPDLATLEQELGTTVVFQRRTDLTRLVIREMKKRKAAAEKE